MSRRDLLRRAVLIMGSIPAAATALTVLGCGGDDDKGSPSPTVAPATKAATTAPATTATAAATAATTSPAAASPSAAASGDITTANISFKGPGSDLVGYLAKPSKAGKYQGVVIVHENRGLVEHLKDVARRYAAEGFVALAVDLVSRDGGSKQDTAVNTGSLGRAKPDDLVADMVGYVNYLKGNESVRAGGVGVTGFCFGGGYAWEAAIASPDVKAAVPYYGIVRLIDDLPKTQAAVLAMYGEKDSRVTSQSDKVKEQLAKTGKPFDVKIFANANHAFFNDTGTNYEATAAKEAWALTLAWFRKYLPA